MASDWKVSTLGELAEIVMGQSPKGTDCNSDGHGTPLLNGPTEFGSNHPYPTQFTTDPKRFSKKDDLLFCVRGSTTGRMNWSDKEYAIGRGLAAFRHKKGKDFQSFLKGIIDIKLPELLASATGSTFPNVSKNQLNDLEVILPPLTEQKAIAHILGSLDDKIELNRQMNETLEAMAQALFKSWFVDFDPVIDNALAAGNAIPDEFMERAEQRKKIEKKDNSDIQSLFPDAFEFTEEMGWIPKGWKMSSLTEVMDFLEGPGIRNWQYTEEEDGIKFINIRCIQDGDIKLATANKITKEEAFGKYEHFQLEVDDIVVSASGTLGRYAFVRKGHLPLSLNTSVIRFRPIEGISTLYYIAGYIDTKLQFELETRATGSAQRNFGPMHLKQISMLLPPINILEKHSEIAKTLFSKRKSNLEQIEALTKLRDTLLPKLMSGELRIPDAVALVENV